MIEELVDKIVMVVAIIFSSEPFRQLAPRLVRHSTNLSDDEDVLDNAESSEVLIRVENQHPVNTGENHEEPGETKVEILGNTKVDTDYGTIPISALDEQPKTLFSSGKSSLCMSLTITVAVIPISLVMVLVLIADVNTSSICYQRVLDNKSLPEEVMKYVIIGHDIEAIALNFWFQLMLVLLFSWKRFRSFLLATLFLGFLLGFIVAIFKTTLFLANVDFTQMKYRYPGNAVFLFGVIYSSYLVSKKVCQRYSSNTRRLKKRDVFAIASTQFFLGSLIAMMYRYVFVPWFCSANSDISQALIAMITPTLIILPVVISENLALKSLPFTDAGRIFVLVYFVNGVSIWLYCIMQAGVEDLRIFIGLSVFRGVLQVFQTATAKFRQKIVARIWKCFEHKCTTCPTIEELEESREHCRLKVDKEIQIMLYQSIAIILGQAYLVLYLTGNYHVKTQEILEEIFMKRVFVGIGISFTANFASILIHIHFHKTKLIEVWYDHWKLHLSAVTLGGVMSICYFTGVLLSVFRSFAQSKSYHIKDCTDPFK